MKIMNRIPCLAKSREKIVGRCAALLCGLWPPLCSGLEHLRRAAFRFDPESLEFQTGALALSVGLWLSLASARPGPNQALLGRLGAPLWPTPLWGIAFAALGLAQIAALGRARLRVRCGCAMIGFGLWMFLFVLAILDPVPGLGVALFPLLALSEAWVYLRLSVPRRCARLKLPFPTEEPPAPIAGADIHS